MLGLAIRRHWILFLIPGAAGRPRTTITGRKRRMRFASISMAIRNLIDDGGCPDVRLSLLPFARGPK